MRITVLLWIVASWICGRIPGGKAGSPLYKNWRMYSVNMSGTNFEALEDFQNSSRSLNILTVPSQKSPRGQVIISPEEFEMFETFLKNSSIDYDILHTNVQRVIDIEKRIIRKGKRTSIKLLDLQNYNTLKDIYKWLNHLKNKYPEKVTVINAGKSYEKRDILGVKLSQNSSKEAIFIEAGMHAREWISPAFALFLINELLTSQNAETQRLAQSYNWYIFPNTNPDGYEFTHKTDRYWRKTRQPYGKCYGADPNRNWDFRWGKWGSSSLPCSDIYPGKNAFSEPEVKSLSTFIKSIDNLKLYISVHAYSLLLLNPFGTKTDNVEKPENYKKISKATVDAIAKRYGTKYIYGNITNTIYPASGNSIDWVYAVAKVPLAFALELRPDPNSKYEFVLPPDQIVPTGEETFDGITAMIKEAEILGYMSKI